MIMMRHGLFLENLPKDCSFAAKNVFLCFCQFVNFSSVILRVKLKII